MASNQSVKVTVAKEWESKPLFSSHGHLLPVSVRVLPLLSPLLADIVCLIQFKLGIFPSGAANTFSGGMIGTKIFGILGAITLSPLKACY